MLSLLMYLQVFFDLIRLLTEFTSERIFLRFRMGERMSFQIEAVIEFFFTKVTLVFRIALMNCVVVSNPVGFVDDDTLGAENYGTLGLI